MLLSEHRPNVLVQFDNCGNLLLSIPRNFENKRPSKTLGERAVANAKNAKFPE